jgi:hypothetical protein
VVRDAVPGSGRYCREDGHKDHIVTSAGDDVVLAGGGDREVDEGPVAVPVTM